MAFTGADYSSARPGGAQLRAAGVYGVMRYLGTPTDGRQIELAEFQDLNAHAVWTGFVRETGETGMLAGHGQGVYDAQVSVANLARLGLSNQVVYAAADFDVQSNQFAALDAYMQGFASVIGLKNTGIYGGMYYINHCRQAGLAPWMWKAAASSWDHGQGGAVHLEQTTLQPPVAGSDHNYIYNADYGQANFNAPGPVPAGRKKNMPLVVGYTGVTPKPVFVFFDDAVRHVKTNAQVTALVKAFGPEVDFAQADFTTIVAYYGLSEYSLNQIVALSKAPSGPGGMLRATATSNAGIKFPPAAAPSDAQIKAIADQISAEVTAGASSAEVQSIIDGALGALKLGTIK